MVEQKKHKVPEYKVKEIKDLAGLIDSHSSLMLASIKSLPARSFQKIKKKLSGRAIVKVIKKRALARAIEESKKDAVKELEKHLKEDIAVIISNIDVFELAGILATSKSPVKAKAGQIADNDIEIEAGVTEIPAGPAVSEFGNASVQVKVTNGKIEVMQTKVVVAKGKEVSEGVASLLGKLDITPFSVGFIPLIAFDSESGKSYTTLTMDKEEVLSEMKNSYGKARALAVSLGYISKDTIGMLLSKAVAHEEALSSHVKEDAPAEEAGKEEVVEKASEEVKEESKEEAGKEEEKDNVQEESKSEEEK
jgi:large subunit ribosomal protein L10